jgi:hypothetical protein
MSGVTYETNAKITKYFKEETPPPPKRAPSPPHEYVLADNPDIAVCIRKYPDGCKLACYSLTRFYNPMTRLLIICASTIVHRHVPRAF